jgi:hypothetical protein
METFPSPLNDPVEFIHETVDGKIVVLTTPYGRSAVLPELRPADFRPRRAMRIAAPVIETAPTLLLGWRYAVGKP